MRRPCALRTAAATGLLVLALAGRSVAAEGSAPTIYKWVDENGIAHYTTNKKRIPRNLRNRIRSLDEVKREQEQAAPAPAPAPATDASRQDFVEGDDPLFADEPGSGEPGQAPLAPAAAAAAAPTPAAAGPPAPAAAPRGGPPVGTDVYAVRDAGDDFGTVAGGQPLEDDPLFEDEPSEGQAVDPNAAARIGELDERIAALEAELAKDERRLKELISGARLEEGKPAPLYGVPELEELARRFPRIQAEIAALRAERRALDAGRASRATRATR
jgi:uncharacterized small protein (DUF1192 family)